MDNAQGFPFQCCQGDENPPKEVKQYLSMVRQVIHHMIYVPREEWNAVMTHGGFPALQAMYPNHSIFVDPTLRAWIVDSERSRTDAMNLRHQALDHIYKD